EKLFLDDFPDRFSRFTGRPRLHRSVESFARPPFRIFPGQVPDHFVSAASLRLSNPVTGQKAALAEGRSCREKGHVLWVALAPEWAAVREIGLDSIDARTPTLFF